MRAIDSRISLSYRPLVCVTSNPIGTTYYLLTQLWYRGSFLDPILTQNVLYLEEWVWNEAIKSILLRNGVHPV